MKPRALIYALVLLATGCAAPTAQTPPAGVAANVTEPQIAVGDTWRYDVRDGFTKLPREPVEYRVTQVAGDRVTVEVRTGERVSTEIYTRSGNWLQRPATNMQVFSYSPAYEALAFPLVPGKTWKSQAVATDPEDGRRFPVLIQGKVVGWERIREPAGEFDALKVQRRVYLDYFRQNVRGQSIIDETDWYVPALRQVARRETTSRYLSWIYGRTDSPIRYVGRDDGGGPRYIQDDWLIYDLAKYSVR
jgi:hypothetical protein